MSRFKQKPNRDLIFLGAVILMLITLVAVNMFVKSPQMPFVIVGCVILVVFSFVILVYENKKQTSKKLAVTATFIVMASLGNFLSVTMVPFEMGTAFIMIVGVILGKHSGFLVGLAARFIVNMFYVQGIWTLWQMLGWGMLGFLAGLSFHKILDGEAQISINYKWSLSDKYVLTVSLIFVILEVMVLTITKNAFLIYVLGAIFTVISVIFLRQSEASTIKLTIFGLFSTLFIYGGIMNLSTVIAVYGLGTMETIAFIYAAGIAYDLLHCVGCALFLYLFAPVVIKIFNRLNLKYKIIE